ncbi:MAG: endo alpha-1,4 polygalactosaminidase [Chloroflexota bacterium]|nr:endo alpha-1,4 polygalactosaminidase [Chloroflexota bacterium]
MKTQTHIRIFVCLFSLLAALLISCRSSDVSSYTVQSESQPNAAESLLWWTPKPGQLMQIQYAGEIDLTVQAEIFNLDLFETTPEEIQYLHSKGVQVICYLNAGAWENWRPDSNDFPKATIGKKYQAWPGEYWLDIRQIEALKPILTARLDLCAEKGFDGVDPDNLDGYMNQTGFPLTYEDQLNFNRWLAAEAHQRHLAIGLKNDPDQAINLVMDFDWITTESCFCEGWCEMIEPFIQAGKPVFAIEYTDEGAQFNKYCGTRLAKTINPILKHQALDAWRETCP